jgi:thioredoxin reductase
VREKRIAVIGQRTKAAGLALGLKTWTDTVVLCSHGASGLKTAQRRQLAAHAIEVVEKPIAAIEHRKGHVQSVEFVDGSRTACDAVFLAGEQRQQCHLARDLGCALTRQGLVKTDHLGQTGIEGLYVAGDASRDVQFVVVAAAEGAKAAVAINKALQARSGLAVKRDA